MSRHQVSLLAAFLTGAVVLGGPSPAQVGKTARPGTPAEKRAGRAEEAVRREAEARARELEREFARLQAIRVGQFVAAPAFQVERVVAAPAAPAGEVNMVLNGVVRRVSMEERYVMMFRPTLRAEYEVLVAVCEPSKDQRRQLARAGESALKAVAAQVSQRRVVNAENTPRKVLLAALRAAAGEHLSVLQVARYQDELAERERQFRQATVRSIVAALDQGLYLSADQRAKLSAALEANWAELQVNDQAINFAGQYFPMLPDKHVVPLLSPEQAKVWHETQKVQLNTFLTGASGLDDKPLEDAELEGAPKSEPGKAPHAPE
jgi:hypothetical protein